MYIIGVFYILNMIFVCSFANSDYSKKSEEKIQEKLANNNNFEYSNFSIKFYNFFTKNQ